MSLYSIVKSIYYFLESKKRKKYLEGLVKKGLKLGNNVEIIDDYFFDPSHCFLITIGDNTTIAPNVRLIAHDASTKKLLGYTKIGKIEIKENCFIGDSTIILPNVCIGPNSIIGSGSVVTKDIPPNTVAVGNPAKVITTIQEYKRKIKSISHEKEIFGRDYYIEKLNEAKRNEIINSIDDNIGFIV